MSAFWVAMLLLGVTTLVGNMTNLLRGDKSGIVFVGYSSSMMLTGLAIVHIGASN